MFDFLNPEDILNQLDLKENMIVADFGCGSGGWVIPLSKRIEDGKIYAIDVLDEPLSVLRARTKSEKIFNIETIKADVERTSKLLPESCDLVLMTNLLFQCEDKKRVLEEGKRVLKNGGKILIVDWKKDNPLTPEVEFCSEEEVKKIAEELGLIIKKELSAGSYHWGLILIKNNQEVADQFQKR